MTEAALPQFEFTLAKDVGAMSTMNSEYLPFLKNNMNFLKF